MQPDRNNDRNRNQYRYQNQNRLQENRNNIHQNVNPMAQGLQAMNINPHEQNLQEQILFQEQQPVYADQSRRQNNNYQNLRDRENQANMAQQRRAILRGHDYYRNDEYHQQNSRDSIDSRISDDVNSTMHLSEHELSGNNYFAPAGGNFDDLIEPSMIMQQQPVLQNQNQNQSRNQNIRQENLNFEQNAAYDNAARIIDVNRHDRQDNFLGRYYVPEDPINANVLDPQPLAAHNQQQQVCYI